MPVATIGLFALALVVVALAFAVSKLVDDGGSAALSPQDVLGTQTAQKTQSAGGSSTQPAGQTAGAGSTTTATANKTPGTPAASPTTGATAGTYTVEAGDFCSTIAEDHGITLQQLLTANKMTEADCNTLKIGQVLKLK
jgi:LysM repeat protein